MSRNQALLKKRPNLGLLPKEYTLPSRQLEMVFNTETGELERGQSNRPNHNVVFLY